MEDHARVLQERIEVRAFGRRREEAKERVGGEQHEEEKAHADEAENARHAGDHLGGQAAGAERDRGAHHPSVTVQKRMEPSWEPQVAATL